MSQIAQTPGGDVASQERHPRIAKLRRFSLEEWLYQAIGGEWGGNVSAPLEHHKIKFEAHHGVTQVAMFVDDAGEIGLGYPDSWHVIYHRRDFDRIVKWYLWEVIVNEWCGLRRWAWYKLLERKVYKINPTLLP